MRVRLEIYIEGVRIRHSPILLLRTALAQMPTRVLLPGDVIEFDFAEKREYDFFFHHWL